MGTFLSYEDLKKDLLIGLLRLRKCSVDTFRKELVVGEAGHKVGHGQGEDTLQSNSGPHPGDVVQSVHCEIRNNFVSIIRELHVYGTAVAVDHKDPAHFQHRGFGAMLMGEAERISREEHRSKKIAVISGVGTRNYYKKFGYVLEGPYMVKVL